MSYRFGDYVKGAGARLSYAQCRLHCTDVFRFRSATTTYKANSGGNEFARIAGHVFGRTKINVPTFHTARHSGVRLGRERKIRYGSESLQRIQHGDRSDRAIASHDVRTPLGKACAIGLRQGTVEAVALVVNGDLRNNRNPRIDFARGKNCLMQFFEIAKSLKDEQINSGLNLRRYLLYEGRARFVECQLSERFDANPKGPDGAGDKNVCAGAGFLCQANSRAIDLRHVISAAVPGEPKQIRAKGVCLNDLSTGFYVIFVDAQNQVRLREVQLVVAAVYENSLAVKQGTHGPVAEHWGTLETG